MCMNCLIVHSPKAQNMNVSIASWAFMVVPVLNSMTNQKIMERARPQFRIQTGQLLSHRRLMDINNGISLKTITFILHWYWWTKARFSQDTKYVGQRGGTISNFTRRTQYSMVSTFKNKHICADRKLIPQEVDTSFLLDTLVCCYLQRSMQN